MINSLVFFGIGLIFIGKASNIYHLIPAVIFLGFSSGIIMVVSNAWLFSNINKENRSKVVGLSMSMNFLGQFSAAFVYQYGSSIFGNRDIFTNLGIALFGIICILIIYKKTFRS